MNFFFHEFCAFSAATGLGSHNKVFYILNFELGNWNEFLTFLREGRAEIFSWRNPPGRGINCGLCIITARFQSLLRPDGCVWDQFPPWKLGKWEAWCTLARGRSIDRPLEMLSEAIRGSLLCILLCSFVQFSNCFTMPKAHFRGIRRMYGYKEIGFIYKLDAHQVISQVCVDVDWNRRHEDVVWIKVLCLNWDGNKVRARSGRLFFSTRIGTEDESFWVNFYLNQDWNSGLTMNWKLLRFNLCKGGILPYKGIGKVVEGNNYLRRNKEGRSKVAREIEKTWMNVWNGEAGTMDWLAWQWPSRRLHWRIQDSDGILAPLQK
ncbi:hypothetical protein VP01_1175g1 [Puccinia sorghi]|uniref:Uncharacterized protein n=1 Tax=Puccinia sorghi TaxID=27349 RepID=A0A0L6VR71_9BASI|nr:hypothetical protein VP01_1175g1 [Puccinia sorghi]